MVVRDPDADWQSVTQCRIALHRQKQLANCNELPPVRLAGFFLVVSSVQHTTHLAASSVATVLKELDNLMLFFRLAHFECDELVRAGALPLKFSEFAGHTKGDEAQIQESAPLLKNRNLLDGFNVLNFLRSPGF